MATKLDISLVRTWLAITFALVSVQSFAEPPILTDEFDAFLVTKETVVGDIVGTIRPVFPNNKKNTWTLEKPIPGGDPRNYLREGQADATEIVDINPETGDLVLIITPDTYPENYYAEVRATNEDGFMEQVLIITARADMPKRENALDIFTQYREASGLIFYATASVNTQKIDHAANVANALLLKDQALGGNITKHLQKANAAMTIFRDFEERNTAVGFYMYAEDFNAQDLEDEEIIPDYFRLGGPLNLRRDASLEEITHLIHGGGIIPAYPQLQARLEMATEAAIERQFFRPWDGLPADSFSHEYLTIGLEIYYGGRQRHLTMGRTVNEDGSPRQPAFRLSTNNDVLLTAKNLEKHDPELYEIVAFLFPTKTEFWTAMGWGEPGTL